MNNENTTALENNETVVKPLSKDKRIIRVASYPTQSFVDKVGKNKAFSVLTSKIDFDNACIHFNVAKGDRESVDVDVSFAEAAETFGWNTFTWSEDLSLIYPEFDGYVPTPEPDYHVFTDKHFNDAGYNWMNELRLTNPMNNSMEGTAKINEQLHQNDGVYYGTFSSSTAMDSFFANESQSENDSGYVNEDDVQCEAE